LFLLFLGAGFPSIAGVVMTIIAEGRAGLRELLRRLSPGRAGVLWYAAAMLTTPIAATVVLLPLAALISPDFQPAILTTPNLVAVLLFALFFGLVIGVLEEIGWIGFALPRLLTRYPAFSAALRLGVVWSLWHTLLTLWVWPVVPAADPLVQIAGGLIWMAALVPYRILMSWVYVNTRSSLLIGIVMHAFYDASLIVLVPAALASDPMKNTQFYAGLTVVLWAAVAIVVAIFEAKSLTRSGSSGTVSTASTLQPVSQD
jgi:membrane protease YdiL (CAAX protease family)